MHLESVAHLMIMRSENISCQRTAVKTIAFQTRVTTLPSGPTDADAKTTITMHKRV